MDDGDVSTARDAQAEDVDELVALWGVLFDEPAEAATPWREEARVWFEHVVNRRELACFPVVRREGRIVACAVGTLELGVPNPHCPHGRTVRLANVVTLAEHRERGYGSALVDFVVHWARTVRADRVDLSSTPEGQRIYARSGFETTTAPRMKLML